LRPTLPPTAGAGIWGPIIQAVAGIMFDLLPALPAPDLELPLSRPPFNPWPPTPVLPNSPSVPTTSPDNSAPPSHDSSSPDAGGGHSSCGGNDDDDDDELNCGR